MYSSFVRTIQSFVCLAEPEAGPGAGADQQKPGPEEKIDLSAAPEPEKAPAEGEIGPRVIAPDSGASIHPTGR